MKKTGFTLAEVLITLTIVGVVAALTIPSVIANSQQQEFKTGLKKAVSVLNSAITMNIALDGETPYDNANLFGYLMKHMTILESSTSLSEKFVVSSSSSSASYVSNAYFYTIDGMRFEFQTSSEDLGLKLHETDINLCTSSLAGETKEKVCGGCGSLGLANNTNATKKPPCLITVDVNGDRKPNPANINCKDTFCAKPYKYSDAKGKKVLDVFSIMITDLEAVPYGVAAQKAMYEARK